MKHTSLGWRSSLGALGWANALGPPIAYCMLIFLLSDQSQLPATPGGDKVAHFAAYFVMGGLFLRACVKCTTWKAAAVVFAAACAGAVYGITDEIHQMFVPGRFPSLGDAVADSMGALVGSVAASSLYFRGWPWRRAIRARVRGDD